MRREGHTGRVRALLPAAVAALALLGLLLAAPHGLARAKGGHRHLPRPAHAPGPSRPDWHREGTFLSAARAYRSVVRLTGRDGTPFCSGAVVHSPGGDLVITAAHCVHADHSYSTGLSVLPGATGDSGPFGGWRVGRIWVDPRYTDDHDERYDYAFLRVARPDGRRIEDAAGADTLRTDQPFDLPDVTATGYPDLGDPGGRQLTCTMATSQATAHPGYREMTCGGYTAGVSGGPWVLLAPGAATGDLVGVIGGFNGGGPPDGTPHADAISYSPYFTEATRALFDQAVRGDGGHDGGN